MTIYKLTIEGRLTVTDTETEEFEATKDLLQMPRAKANYILREALRELDNCSEVTIKLVEQMR